MTSFREERTKQKKLEILRKSAEIFNEKGYQGTTIEEIANHLKVTKASLYYYVASKEDLLYQCHEMIADESITKLQDIIQNNIEPRQKLVLSIEAHIKHTCEEKSMFHLVVRPSDLVSDEIRNEIIHKRDIYESLFKGILSEGMEKGQFIETDIKITLLQILGSLNSISQWYSPTGNKTQREISDIFVSNFMAMLEKK